MEKEYVYEGVKFAVNKPSNCKMTVSNGGLTAKISIHTATNMYREDLDGWGADHASLDAALKSAYEMLAENVHLYASLGRSVERPWGLAGGGHGTNNYLEVVSNGDRWRGARVPTTQLKRGDYVRIVTGGGGGYGIAAERPAEDVAEDVSDGFLTAKRAREQYQVVLGTDGAVDRNATAALRQAG